LGHGGSGSRVPGSIEGNIDGCGASIFPIIEGFPSQAAYLLAASFYPPAGHPIL